MSTTDADADACARLELLRTLARRLEENTTLDTERSRANCRELAGAILELLDEGDERELPALPPMMRQEDAERVEALRAAVGVRAEARDPYEFTR